MKRVPEKGPQNNYPPPPAHLRACSWCHWGNMRKPGGWGEGGGSGWLKCHYAALFLAPDTLQIILPIQLENNRHHDPTQDGGAEWSLFLYSLVSCHHKPQRKKPQPSHLILHHMWAYPIVHLCLYSRGLSLSKCGRRKARIKFAKPTVKTHLKRHRQ